MSLVTADGLEVLDERVTASRLEQTLRIPAELPCLEGHFPKFPVLPGIAQLEWAARSTARLRGAEVVVAGLEALKFRALLRPGETFVATLDAAADRDRAAFELVREGQPVASGRFCLAAEMAPLEGRAMSPPEQAERCAREFVPQAGPMVFVDRVLASEPKQTCCSLQVEKLALFREPGGALPGWAGVEAMAQCVAAHGGLEARRRGCEPGVGFLLGCRRLRIGAARLEPRIPYAMVATQVWGGDEGLVSFDCELFEREGGARLLAGRINAYLPASLSDLEGAKLGE